MKTLTDKEMESWISTVLLTGVLLSAVLICFGAVLYLRNGATIHPDYTHFQSANPALRSLSDVVHGTMSVKAEFVIQLGLLLLIATPVIRVAFCIVGFAQQRDRLYVAISAVVLGILIYSFFHRGQ